MKLVGTFLFAFGCLTALGQQQPTATKAITSKEREITLEDIYKNMRFTPIGGKQHDLKVFGHSYVDLRKSSKYPGMPNVKDVWVVDPISGKEEKIIPSDLLVDPTTKCPLVVEEVTLTDNCDAALLITQAPKPVLGQETWFVDITNGTMELIAIKNDPSGIRMVTLSPDKKKVAFSKNNNIFIKEIGSKNVISLTSDGSKEIINGASSGQLATLLSVRGIKWSPDNKHVAFTKFIARDQKNLILINNTDSLYPFIKSIPFIKPGEKIPSTTVGIVNIETKDLHFAALPGNPDENYITYFDWKPNSPAKLMIQQLSRKQNDAKFFSVNPDGITNLVYQDKDNAFLIASDINWLDGGKTFLWVSEKSGWRHIYRVSSDGKQEIDLIKEPFDIEDIVGINAKKNLVYFIASPKTSIYRFLYAVKMDGSSAPYRVTPNTFVGVNKYQFSADGEYAYHTYSTINTPPVIDLINVSNHMLIKNIENNHKLNKELAKVDIQPAKFIKIDIGDGIQLDSWQILPVNFDPKKKYPVIFHVYSMPGNQVAKDNWLNSYYMWYQMMAQKGYIIMNIDGRGTPALYGRAWRKVIYGRHGILPSDDIAKATKKLIADQPYIDADNIGIFGWSGGGMISLLQILRYPEIYKAAAPGAFLSSNRFYNAAFTERFMGLPQENGEAYDTTAALSYVNNLKGKLLLLHGTGDDNVNYQSTEVLVNKLIEAGKTFNVVPYPNRKHGLKEAYHQFKTYTTFFDESLKPKH